LIEGLLRALRAARDFRPQGCLRFEVGADPVGWVRRDQAGRLHAWPEVFEFSSQKIQLRSAPEAILSARLAEVASALARDGTISGWRDETYAIRADSGAAVVFRIERAAKRFFGVTSSAAHLNGFVLQNEKPTIWIARRSATKPIDPGMLDNLVAGGVPSGQDAWQTLLRECGEEAGIPGALAAQARPAGVLLACRAVPDGLDSEFLYIYDLALPADFTPRNTDGEVSEFLSLDAAALRERIARGEMSVEAGLVAADFALRHAMLQDEDGKIAAAIEACRDLTLP
jgi:8-oxo-dGTP pyrophosphatase MutT (NUDIX family)